MGRNFSPILSKELANLQKDSDSRKTAMEALKSYVKDLDSKAIPLFLEQVSETKETGSLSGEYTISLYEVLARVHGVNIVPQIDSIMATIVKTLVSSAGSFPLQQACSKVVPAIARYGIDPTTTHNKKRHIIHSLCKPLSDSLLGSRESLTAGAALCLRALVESDNWRFASNEMVNKVCQNAVAALEDKSTQTNSHMGLVMALAKHNAFVVEAYVRLLVQSGLHILHAGLLEANSQKRLSAVQMINFLMKSLDPRSIYSELELIIQEMEKCQSDQMAFVKGAAFEALETARRILMEKGPNFKKDHSPVNESNSHRTDHQTRGRNLWGSGDLSSGCVSPESQTLDSCLEYDFLIESPVSSRQESPSISYDSRSVNRRLYRVGNGVNVSLKDGLFPDLAYRSDHFSDFKHKSKLQDSNKEQQDDADDFTGFNQCRGNGAVNRSPSSTPERPCSRINIENIKIFSTPRKLIHSLQDPSDISSESSDEKGRRSGSPSSSICNCRPMRKRNQNDSGHHPNGEITDEESSYADREPKGRSESVSSTDDIPASGEHASSHAVIPTARTVTRATGMEKNQRKIGLKVIGSLFVILLAIFASLILSSDKRENIHLVPT